MNKSTWLKIGGVLGAAIATALLFHAMGLDLRTLSPERVRAFVLSFGVSAPLIYILVYGQPLLPLPASLMMGLAGAAFGKTWGTVYAMLGAMLRAVTEFFVARLLGREAVAKLLKGNAAALNQRLGEDGFKAVLLIRLIPNLPFDVQNYGLGFSRVKAAPYLLATFLGVLPGCVLFVCLGESLLDPKQIWKLALMIMLIIGLMGSASAWKKRHAVPQEESR